MSISHTLLRSLAKGLVEVVGCLVVAGRRNVVAIGTNEEDRYVPLAHRETLDFRWVIAEYTVSRSSEQFGDWRLAYMTRWVVTSLTVLLTCFGSVDAPRVAGILVNGSVLSACGVAGCVQWTRQEE